MLLWVMELFLSLALPLAATADIQFYAEPWLPYQYERGGTKGISVAVVREMIKQAGDKDTIQIAPWNRGYELTLRQSGYGLFLVTRTEEREKMFEWVGPLYSGGVYLLKKRGTLPWLKSLEDAKKVDFIRVIYNDRSHHFLKKLGFENIMTMPGENPEYWKQLIENDVIKLVITTPETIPYRCAESGIDRNLVENTGIKLYDSEFYLAFSKGTDAKVVQKYQAILDQMKQSGLYQKIIQQARAEALKDFGITP